MIKHIYKPTYFKRVLFFETKNRLKLIYLYISYFSYIILYEPYIDGEPYNIRAVIFFIKLNIFLIFVLYYNQTKKMIKYFYLLPCKYKFFLKKSIGFRWQVSYCQNNKFKCQTMALYNYAVPLDLPRLVVPLNPPLLPVLAPGLPLRLACLLFDLLDHPMVMNSGSCI